MNRNKMNSSVAIMTYRREVAAGTSDSELDRLAQSVRSAEIDRDRAGSRGKGLGGSKFRLDKAVTAFAKYARAQGIEMYEFPAID